MPADFTIKQHDRLPAIVANLTDDNFAAVNLGGCTVRFILTNKSTGVKAIDASATITDATNGQVSYSWANGDTDVAGTYAAEWEVTFGDGRAETFPNSRNLDVLIYADLGGIAA